MGDQANSSMSPQWKGLFDWSMSYHDGTRPTDFAELGKPDPEKLKWYVCNTVLEREVCTVSELSKQMFCPVQVVNCSLYLYG